MKFWKKLLLGAFLLITTFIIYLVLNIRSLSIEKINDDLFVIRGVGGNTTILNTDAGTVVVDSMTFKMQGELIRKKAEELTGKEVVLLVNTHYHLDHTHGNLGFNAGTRVSATKRTLSHLQALDSNTWQGEAGLLLPNDTFTDQRRFDFGNKTVTLIHPGKGHTDGDLVVLFEEDKTLVAGDLFFHQHYPNIDLEAGGSVRQWSTTLDQVLALDFDQAIPGHGSTSNRQGLINYQNFIIELANIGELILSESLSLEETLKTDKLKADHNYQPIAFAGIPLGLNREFVLRRTWEEYTGNFQLRN